MARCQLPPAPQLYDDMRPMPSLYDPPPRFEDRPGFDWLACWTGFALGACCTAAVWTALRSAGGLSP